MVSVTFNNDTKSPLLIAGDTEGNVVIWDLTPWETKHEQPKASGYLPTGPGATTSVWGLTLIPGDPFTLITGRSIGYLNRNKIVVNKDDFSKTSLQRESLGLTGNNIGVFRIDVSPNGELIAAAGQDGLVSLWNTAETTNVIRHTSNVTSFQLIQEGATSVMSLDSKGMLFTWDYETKKKSASLLLDASEIVESAINPDGTRVVTGSRDGTITLLDSETGKKLAAYSKHQTSIASLVFSPDGKHLASSDEQGSVILWNVLDNDKLGSSAPFTDTHHSTVPSLLFSPDGSKLIGAGCGYPIFSDCSQGAIYVWDTQPQLKLRGEPLPGKSGFAWSLALNSAAPNELAVGTLDGTVTIWNWQTRTARLTFRLGKGNITALAFSPVHNLLAVGADGYKVFIYNTRTGQMFGQAFREHDGPVIALAFTPDGGKLLSASNDGTIVLHDMNPVDWVSRACQVANRNLTHNEWQQYIGNALPFEPVCPDLPFEP